MVSGFAPSIAYSIHNEAFASFLGNVIPHMTGFYVPVGILSGDVAANKLKTTLKPP